MEKFHFEVTFTNRSKEMFHITAEDDHKAYLKLRERLNLDKVMKMTRIINFKEEPQIPALKEAFLYINKDMVGYTSIVVEGKVDNLPDVVDGTIHTTSSILDIRHTKEGMLVVTKERNYLIKGSISTPTK